MKMARHIVSLVLSAAVFAGCAGEEHAGPAPINVPEYRQMDRANRRTRWPDNRIVQMNLTRVGNEELPSDKRMASLQLVAHIAHQQPGILSDADLADMSTLLRDPDCPKDLRRRMLIFLLNQNAPDLSPLIAGQMDAQSDPELSQAVMKYLGENAPPQMLSGIVRSWAREETITGPNETHYRQAVEKVSGKAWDETLLTELNNKAFDAKGEAIQILRARLGIPALRRKLLSLHPETDEMEAVQAFVEQFDYLPTTRERLLTTTILYEVRRSMMPDAARMSLDWTKSYGYDFAIQDFHLLSRLARDPLRSNRKRTQMVLDIGQAFKTRKHVKHTPLARGGNDDYPESFWLQVDKLTMSDLWNLYLLNEMLSRPQVQISLRLMADGDLEDRRSAWGGLVFYQNGQAEAILYPPARENSGDDQAYPPTQRLITDGRDSLCRFVGHFDRMENASRAGPSVGELADAETFSYYGLVLTRVDPDHFCAHYYNPDGVVVSLGKFPLRQPKP